MAIVLFSYYQSSMDPKLSNIFSTLLGGMFVSLWRAVLMPIDTCKTVAQVEGSVGLHNLITEVYKGHWYLLFEGTIATLLATFIGHYPWFFVHNYLESTLIKPTQIYSQVLRHGFIGFISSAISDTTSNSLRVIKTVKQAVASESNSMTYFQVISQVYLEGGIAAIFGRGLGSRILSNGLQSVIFTIVWKLLVRYLNERDQIHKNAELDQGKSSSDLENIV